LNDGAIHADSLTRDFGTVRAVDGLTFDAPRGEVFGLLGPNGAGKTTTIHLLLGLLEPFAGRAEVLDVTRAWTVPVSASTRAHCWSTPVSTSS
jgi:ABC-2 type transport system ATP-binding protein